MFTCKQRQFGFKEILRSAVHVAFLDASKAFDRVNRHKLITKLAQRDVPKYFFKSDQCVQ